MEEQLKVMGARRRAGHSLAAPDSLGQKVEQACHVIFGPVIFCPEGRSMIAIFGPDKI